MTSTLKAAHETLLAHNWPLSTVMYLVRTVWELMRLNNDTGPPARMHDVTLRVFAVFFEGFDMIVTGAESNEAQTRGLFDADTSPDEGGSAISRESWKLFDLAVPETCKNLKLAVKL